MTENLIGNTFFMANLKRFGYLTIEHTFMQSELPKWEQSETWKKISTNENSHRSELSTKAQFFCGFLPTFWKLGSQPGELRLHIEPLHDLCTSELNERLQSIATRFNVPIEKVKAGGLTFISRPLLNALHPEADFFENITAPFPFDENLFLYDPLTGFIILDNGDQINNDWFGGKVEISNLIRERNSDREKLIFKNQQDLLNVGVSVWEKVLKPIDEPDYKKDLAGIPSVTVHSQAQLEKLIEQIESACDKAPFAITQVYRGQSGEYLLPDRLELAQAGITPYSNVRDHSLLPSIYRDFERQYDEPNAYTDFVGDLVRWHFYERAIFADDEGFAQPSKDATSRKTFFLSSDLTDTRSLDSSAITVTEYYDTQGKLVEKSEKHHRLVHDDSRRNLILQHYGAPTPVVDVTSDYRVAEFFAFTKLQTDKYGGMTCEPVTDVNSSVLYVLFVPKGMAPLYRSDELLPHEEALRPSRQACLTLGGSGTLYRNFASRFIGLKIKFANEFVPCDLPSASHLFPSRAEDLMLDKLLIAEKVFGKNNTSRPVYWLRE